MRTAPSLPGLAPSRGNRIELRTHKHRLGPTPGMPTGIWDPLWNDPTVASRIAALAFGHLAVSDFVAGLRPDSELPTFRKHLVVQRSFALDQVHALDQLGVRFRGGSFGEIYKLHAFGNLPPAHFHAQALTCGADSGGRFFLEANVGTVGSTPSNEAGLVVRFVDEARAVIGGIAWQASIPMNTDVPLRVLGRSDELRQRFDQLAALEIDFYSHGSRS